MSAKLDFLFAAYTNLTHASTMSSFEYRHFQEPMDRVIASQDIGSHIRKAKIVQVGGAATGRRSGGGAGDDTDDNGSSSSEESEPVIDKSLVSILGGLRCDSLLRDPDMTSWETRFRGTVGAVAVTSVPESALMLEADVVGPLLLSDNVAVEWRKILDGEVEVGRQMFMPDLLLGKPAHLYSKDNVCKASGLHPKSLKHSFPLMGTDPYRQRNLFITRPYKNRPDQVWRAILDACEARKEKYDAAKARQGRSGPVTCYGSGGSSLPMGSSVPKIGMVAENPQNDVVVLELSEGQSFVRGELNGSDAVVPSKNCHYLENLREQQIFGMFVDLVMFCSDGQLRYLCRTYPFLLTDVNLPTGYHGDLKKALGGRLLFVDYLRLDNVVFERSCGRKNNNWGDLFQQHSNENSDEEDSSTLPEEAMGDPAGASSLPTELGPVPDTPEKMIEKYGPNSSFLDVPHFRFVFAPAFTDLQMRLMIKREGLSTSPPERRYTVVQVNLDDATGSVLSLSPEQGREVGLGKETVRRQQLHHQLRSGGYRKYIKTFCFPTAASKANLLLPKYGWGGVTEIGTTEEAAADSESTSYVDSMADSESTSYVDSMAGDMESVDEEDERKPAAVAYKESTSADEEEETSSAESSGGGPAPFLEEATTCQAETVSGTFGDGCYAEFALLLSAITHAAAARFLGKGLIRRAGVLYALPLPADHSSNMFAANPASVPNRSLDVVPLSVLSIAGRYGFGNIRQLRRSGKLSSEISRGPFVVRTLLQGPSAVTDGVGSFFSNVMLARFTGRVSFLRAMFEISSTAANDTSSSSSREEKKEQGDCFSLGLAASSDGDEDDRAFLGPVLESVLATVPKFSRQHFNSIPKSVTSNLATAVRQICNSGSAFIGKLKNNRSLWQKADRSSPERIAEHFRACQRVFFEMVRDLIAETVGKAPHPKGKFTRSENFMANQVVLDIQLALSPVFLEPYRIVVDEKNGACCVPTIGYCGDPNVVAYPVEDTAFGFGGAEGAKFLEIRRRYFSGTNTAGEKKKKRSVDLLYNEFLHYLRSVPETVLHSIDLASVLYQPKGNNESFRVIYDILSGNIFCARMFEHCLCKVEVYVKNKTAGYCFTQDSSFARPWSHPVVFGEDPLHLRRFPWHENIPNIDLLFLFIEQSYLEAHNGQAVVPPYCSMGPNDPSTFSLGSEEPVQIDETVGKVVEFMDFGVGKPPIESSDSETSEDMASGHNSERTVTDHSSVEGEVGRTRGRQRCTTDTKGQREMKRHKTTKEPETKSGDEGVKDLIRGGEDDSSFGSDDLHL